MVNLAPGQKVVFVTTMTVERSCTPGFNTKGAELSSFYARNQSTSDGAPYEVLGTSYTQDQFSVSGGGKRCPEDIGVIKTVDKESAASGEERVFTITVNNPNTDHSAIIGSLDDEVFHTGYQGFETAGTITCADTSTAPCPVRDEGQPLTQDKFSLTNVELPAGSTLVLKVPVRFEATCSMGGGTGYNVNSVSANRITVNDFALSGQSGTAKYEISGIPECEIPQLDISAERTSPEVVYKDQKAVDRLTITNNATVAVTSVGLDVSATGRPAGFSQFLDRKIECVESESTGDCAAFTYNSFSGYSFDLGPGKTLVLRSSASIETDGVCPPQDPGEYITRYFLSGTNIAGNREAFTGQRVGCNDVTVETSFALNSSPQAGEEYPVRATVANEAGISRDIAFSMVLPQNGYIFDPTRGDALVCEVASNTSDQNVRCPQLTFDRESHSVSGTIPVLGTGDSIRVQVNGAAGVVPAKSYPITTRVESAGDTNPDSNVSSINFGVANTQVPTFGEVTVHMPEGATLGTDLVFPARMECRSSGTTNAELRVAAGNTSVRGPLNRAVWHNDDCVVTFQRPDAPAGFAWDGDFSMNPVALDSVQADATARTEVTLVAVTPTPSPSVSAEPTPPVPSPTASAEPTPPAPSPTASAEPTPVPTTPGPSPSVSVEPTTPAPSPSVSESPTSSPTPEPTTTPTPTEEPSPTAEPTPSLSVSESPTTRPTPSPTASAEPTSPAPSPSVTEGPTPTPSSTPEPTTTPTPTEEPSPTVEPTQPTPSPSVSEGPTSSPVPSSSPEPSTEPTTFAPSPTVSAKPTRTADPTGEPSATSEPSVEPTGSPSSAPLPAPGTGAPSTEASAPVPVVPGAGPAAPEGSHEDDPAGVHVGTGFDSDPAQSRSWWLVGALVALGAVAGGAALVLRRRDGRR